MAEDLSSFLLMLSLLFLFLPFVLSCQYSRAKIVFRDLRMEGKVLSRITEFLLSHGKSSAQRRLFQSPIRHPDVIVLPSLIPV